MRSVLLAVLPAALLATAAAPALSQEGASHEEGAPHAAAIAPPVEELVAQALERSPALAARRAAVAAAQEMEAPARALPDPIAEGMLQNAGFPDFTVGTEEMSMAGVEVRQSLPYPGKRAARGEAAQADTAVRRAELAETESRVAAEVRALYAKLYALDSERQSHVASRELMDLLAATARARYSSGESDQEAVLKAQLQGSRLGEHLDDLESERAALVAELNRWLGRPGSAPLGEVRELPVLAAVSEEALEAAAVAASPAVQVARAAVAAAERRLAVSRLDLKPDFAPVAGLATRGSLGPVLTLRFGVELPFWKSRKQEPRIRAAEQKLEEAHQELADAEAMARAEAARVAVRRQQAERQIVRFREAIVPQTRAALNAARASYLAGGGDFSTVIEDFGLWLDARVQLARREADRFSAWADLQRLAPASAGGQP